MAVSFVHILCVLYFFFVCFQSFKDFLRTISFIETSIWIYLHHKHLTHVNIREIKQKIKSRRKYHLVKTRP